ncbi:MAG: hypothetical protein EXR75_11870 [Myxococcales bacterium]|nr:hypothetical protein [Myxococcales bacterium]
MSLCLPLEVRLETAIAAVHEVATCSLGAPSIEQIEEEFVEEAGAYLPLISEHECLHVGLFSTRAGADSLSRTLLGISPERALSDGDIADAIGEIVNIFGGVMQRALQGELKRVDLGLPVFVWGSSHRASGGRACRRR